MLNFGGVLIIDSRTVENCGAADNLQGDTTLRTLEDGCLGAASGTGYKAIAISLINLGFDGWYPEQSASNSNSQCRFWQCDQCNQGQVHLLSLMRAGELITAGSQDAVKATADQLCLLPVNNGLVSGQVCNCLKKTKFECQIPNQNSNGNSIRSYMDIYKTVPQKN